MILVFAVISRAGGTKFVAGTTYFDSTTAGQPLVWSQGLITYYTDQGDLSSYLPNASANALVATAFSQWTAVPTAAVTATRGGQLAEDVNGANVIVNADGTISMPFDVQPTATATPVGIVYDYDGSVTDALMGSGAGDSRQCFSNAVFGGNDNYGALATYQHALIVMNGQCAQQASQLNDVKYRLVRVIGRVLGLGWSQVNPNVLTGAPHPTSDDYAGFPVMHFIDPWNCAPITLCYPNPIQLAMDDVAALSRLYPVTAQNQSSFPGKQVFAATTARIHGSVWFTDSHGHPTQAMQGVNVVARWIDPSTGLPSRRYAASSVSGFLFSGNVGNPITGFDDSLGDPLAEWGSGSQTVEGYFDLAGLKPPNGSSAQYQLSVEALDAKSAAGVGSYSPGPVAPSGSFAPIVVTVSPGNDLEQDILMVGSARPIPHAQSTWTSPAPVPTGGDWVGSLSGYGNVAYFNLAAQANRTLTVAVTALDENGNASQIKAQPVIGIWAASDPPGTAPPGLHALSVQSGNRRHDTARCPGRHFVRFPDRNFRCARGRPPRLPLSRAYSLRGLRFSCADWRPWGRGHPTRQRLRSRINCHGRHYHRNSLRCRRRQNDSRRARAWRWNAEHHDQRRGERGLFHHDRRADFRRSRQRQHRSTRQRNESRDSSRHASNQPHACARAGRRRGYPSRWGYHRLERQ
jgi:hypothetical protein